MGERDVEDVGGRVALAGQLGWQVNQADLKVRLYVRSTTSEVHRHS